MKKQQTQNDWHSKDIIAAVHKTGASFQRMSRSNGYSANTLTQALFKPYPKCERIIAAHLKLSPQSIWPSRYNLDGTPKSAKGQRGLGRYKNKLALNEKPSVCNSSFIHQTEKTNNTQVNNPLPIKQLQAA